MSMTYNLKDLARVGAQARLTEIREEQAALLTLFPELRDDRQRGRKAASNGVAAAKPTRRRPLMSAAMRKAVGLRMRAYWAKRRAEKANGAGEGVQADASSNGAFRKSGRKARRKQGRKK